MKRGRTQVSQVNDIRSQELESISSEVRNNRRIHVLTTLDERGGAQELVRQQYSGRYPFELLQNANDAATEKGMPAPVEFILTDEALIVGDGGAGFGPDQIEAICRLGRSSKDPAKSIGYKGLGFKSVGEITLCPQIISANVMFEFNEERVRAAVQELAAELLPSQRLPVYAFPFELTEDHLGTDAALVAQLRDRHSTVVRLPFNAGVDRSQVQAHLIENLNPRLLLLLSSVETLELCGTTADFSASVIRVQTAKYEEVLLEVNSLQDNVGGLSTVARQEHWRIYRETLQVDPILVHPMGAAWRDVKEAHLAVAVPFDECGKPTDTATFPLHVYFPTEETSGLPVLLHADFALELDRRRLANAPEAAGYNDLLLEGLSSLLADVVAPSLTTDFPHGTNAMASLVPKTNATGHGITFLNSYVIKARASAFIPTVGAGLVEPANVSLLPSSVRDPIRAHRFMDADAKRLLVIPELDGHVHIHEFLFNELEAAELNLEDVLRALRKPQDSEIEHFYDFLVTWSDDFGHKSFANKLKNFDCVILNDGSWASPSSGIYFQRQREETEFPVDLPIRIAKIPEVDGLRSLLAAAGVKPFEWRELVINSLMPPLTAIDTEPSVRKAAMEALRIYFRSQRSGDQTIEIRVRSVLLVATDIERSNFELKAAKSVYFGRPWPNHEPVEALYGPFQRVEFLAESIPDDEDELADEMRFLTWLGVSGHPKAISDEADQRGAYMVDNWWLHPHREVASWNSWWNDEEVAQETRCGQRHPQSQQIQNSFVLDRFDELVQATDGGRLGILWRELSQHWPYYEARAYTTFYCQASSHRGDRSRVVPSIMMHQLTRSKWVPAFRGGSIQFSRPDETWRPANDTPGWIIQMVPVLPSGLLGELGIALSARLGSVDAARPNASNLVDLLGDLAEISVDGQVDKASQRAARWAMRALNDVLQHSPLPAGAEDTPLLVRFRNESSYRRNPLYSSEPLNITIWQKHFPILDSDRDFKQLPDALGLRRLDDPISGVQTVPVELGNQVHNNGRVERSIRFALPYLAAVAIGQMPSREEDIVRRLSRMEVVVYDQLSLQHTFDGIIEFTQDGDSFIAVRRETGGGSGRRNIATAHIKASGFSGEPDWFAFGPQLANYLSVPSLGDAFTTILSGTGDIRRRLLAAKGLKDIDLDHLGAQLDSAALGDALDERIFIPPIEPSPVSVPAESGGATVVTLSTEPPSVNPVEPSPAHPTGPIAVSIRNVTAKTLNVRDAKQLGGHRRSESKVRHRSVEMMSEERRQMIGRLGERIALEMEKQRVAKFGDTNAVVWRSDTDPYSPFDIESIAEDGRTIYIEVKATTGKSPSEPFPISRRELEVARTHGPNYYIYRVTSVESQTPQVSRFQDLSALLDTGRASLEMLQAELTLGDVIELG